MDGRTATGPSVCTGRSCTGCRELQRRVEQLERELREERARARRAELRSERLQADVHVLERKLEEQLQQDLQDPQGGIHAGTDGGGPGVGADVSAAPATPDVPVPQSPQQLPARAAGAATADGVHGAPGEQLHEPQLQQHYQQQASPLPPPPQQQQQQRQSPTPPATTMEHSPGNGGRQHGDLGWRS